MASEELYADQDKFNEALAEYNALKQELPASRTNGSNSRPLSRRRPPVDSRRAAAIALTVVGMACRVIALVLCALTVALCFNGVATKLNIVTFVVELTQTLPDVIAGYGLIATPFRGRLQVRFRLHGRRVLCARLPVCVAPARFDRIITMNIPYLVSLLSSACALIIGIVIHERACPRRLCARGTERRAHAAASRSTRSTISTPLARCCCRSS